MFIKIVVSLKMHSVDFEFVAKKTCLLNLNFLPPDHVYIKYFDQTLVNHPMLKIKLVVFISNGFISLSRTISGRWVILVLVDLAQRYILTELVTVMLHPWSIMMTLHALRYGILCLFRYHVDRLTDILSHFLV